MDLTHPMFVLLVMYVDVQTNIISFHPQIKFSNSDEKLLYREPVNKSAITPPIPQICKKKNLLHPLICLILVNTGIPKKRILEIFFLNLDQWWRTF
ncbi:hypothetical protein GDO81_012444 [Engystomops pustulosus]|uniref:Uncharacterized protein n=1 Tax=Engystomops pustulosus TaxID=76066 RepID=A0AAV7BLQ2_ENGPU|nr:hypothetical protein GDO81_012444 [Engystomops pustulosus]